MDKILQFVEEFDRTPIEKSSDVNSIITDQICNSPITMDEILTHLAKLKSRKAAGADSISGEFIKYTSDDIAPTLFTLYNSILDKGDCQKHGLRVS